MIRLVLLALALTLTGAVPRLAAAADDPAAFTPAQRAEIVAIMRDALKRDPGILRDAIAALQQDEGARQQDATRAAIAAAHAQLTSRPTDPIAGNPAGDVTLVEFYDVRCPYCRQMHPVFDALLAKDPGIRLVFKDLPILGPASVLGARALLAAQRQGGYLKLQAILMSGPPDITDAVLKSDAAAAGLDWARLTHDMADPIIQGRLDTNLALGRALNIDGTPAIVAGDRILPGAVDLAMLQSVVAQLRQQN